jgi:hypothetical protein
MSADPYTRVIYHGVTLNRRTAAMCDLLQERLGRSVGSFPQGSYHQGTSQSAGTHDGGGAVDIYDNDLDAVQHHGRAVGFAAWHRTFLPGEWSAHCHMIALADKEMSSAARGQIPDYRNYKDGLASHAPDNTWHPFERGQKPRPIFNYVGYLTSGRYASGDVYVAKLHIHQTNSDSVARLQYRLKHHTHASTPSLLVDGNYGPRTRDAVAHWQHKIGEAGTNDGSKVDDFQAHKIFGDKYHVIA